MIICSLKGLSPKICRQAFLLARGRVPVAPASFGALRRCSYSSSLYKMVKKRTLEARTKQPTGSNNQPCLTSSFTPMVAPKAKPAVAAAATVTATNQPAAKPTSSGQANSPPQRILQPIKSYSSTAPNKPNIAPKQPSNQSKPSQSPCTPVEDDGKGDNAKNVGILKADFKLPPPPKSGPPRTVSGGGGSGDGSSGPGGPCPTDEDKNKNLLLALLAGLAAGGVIIYFLLRKKDEKDLKVLQTGEEGRVGGSGHSGPRTMPASSSMLPKHVPYLLIGGGTASFSAFRAIKSNDPKAKVLMITNELRKPYMRPPLSKELWYSNQKGEEVTKDYRFKQWTGAERSLYFEPDEFFVEPHKLVETVNGGIAVAQGFVVKKIDPENRIVTLTDGYEIGYDECLIATGCTPKGLHAFDNAPLGVKDRIMYYRTPEDFERLKRYADEKKSITIIGNGFIGSELACSLANYAKDRNVKIYQVFPETGNMSKVLPEYLSKWTTNKVEALGVCVVPNATVTEAKRDESMLKLQLSNGNILMTDVAVVCVGCEANTALAKHSGLEVDRKLGGFVVNAELEARRNLFVAGDASCFYDPLLGRRRVEHHDHSVVSGRLAGENMVGKKKAYSHQSMFWSDLGPEIGYEGIGLVDASLPTVGVFALPSKADRQTDNLTTEARVEELETAVPAAKGGNDVACQEDYNYGRGVIFYLKDDVIVGILLWNLFNRIGLARTIINQNKKYDDLNEVAKLFEIHS